MSLLIEPAETSSTLSPSAKIKPHGRDKRVAIAPAFRVAIVVTLVAVDLLGAMIAAKALWPTGGPLFWALLGAGVILGALMLGLYGSASSDQVSMSVRSIAAFAIAVLPLAFIGASIHAGYAAASHVLLASVGLVVLAPLLLLVAVLVRLETPGPALFRQRRLGRNSQPFTLLKFRSMRVNAAATDGSVQATRADARVTRIGAILRKTSIDELPQLMNVLNGSMSLVGPRPHPVVLDRLIQPIIEDYLARLRVPPGMTGWAQVNGLRGETQLVEQMRRRVELDLEYIKLRSVGFDLWIILRTVLSVISGRNAY